MNKKITFCLLLLASINAPAMQRQIEPEPSLRQEASADRQQQQKQKKKDKQKQHNQDNKNPVEQPTADPEIDDLNAEMAAIVRSVEQTYGSVQGMMTHLKHKEHKRICPTCGRPAEVCEADRGRIAHGNIMLCGCPACGGLQI
jgi:Ni/Co efflux regulator RcnB